MLTLPRRERHGTVSRKRPQNIIRIGINIGLEATPLKQVKSVKVSDRGTLTLL